MKFYRHRSSNLWKALVSAIIAALCGFGAACSYRTQGIGSLYFLIGAAGAAYSLFATIVWLPALTGDQLYLDFSPEGLLISNIARERIVWDDILDASISSAGNQFMVKLEISEAAVQRSKRRWSGIVQGLLYGKSTFFLMANGTGLSAAKLLALIKSRGID